MLNSENLKEYGVYMARIKFRILSYWEKLWNISVHVNGATDLIEEQHLTFLHQK